MTRNEEIKEMRKQGLTYVDIGWKYGLSRQRVEQICKTIFHNKYYCKRYLKSFAIIRYGSICEFSKAANISAERLSVILNHHTPIRYSTAKKIHNALKEYKFEDLFEEV